MDQEQDGDDATADVSYMADILAESTLVDDDIVFDEGMREADAAALAALLADGTFLARFERVCGPEKLAAAQRAYSHLHTRDVGREVEAVVGKYGAPYLRPTTVAERVSEGSLADAACWSCCTLLRYAHADFCGRLLEQGRDLTLQGRFEEALGCLEGAIAAAPDLAEAHNILGRVHLEQGDVALAVRSYERCLESQASAATPAQNRLLALNYLPHEEVPQAAVFEAHRSWGAAFAERSGPAFEAWPALRAAGGRLRLGYTSPDVCDCAPAFFIRCLLEHHSPESFEVFVYSSAPRCDARTAELKALVPAAHWRDVCGHPADHVAAQIREDGVGILVDLAGHTAENRLDVVALRPAPVQVTYLGYLNTTGLPTVDYLLTDAALDPPSSEQQFTERLLRLPRCSFCYTPPPSLPDVTWTAGAARGGDGEGGPPAPFTFGSFNNLAKLSAPCLVLWARVLREVPGSVLMLKTHGLQSEATRAKVAARFAAQGVPPDRLRLVAPSPRGDLWEAYNRVDVALDPFPYNSVTTACEAFVMSVPLVSLRGRAHCARVGVALLAEVGLEERCAAATEDEYVKKAARLAGDPAGLSDLRSGGLRRTFLSSPLCDGPAFVRGALEPALREMWRERCDAVP